MMDIKFDENGLVPVIAQDIGTGEVLMLAYMNEESLKLTIETGVAHYYSRSRKELWKKGGTSGNIQEVKGIYYDCDGDSILLKINQVGVACHTGNYSCFFNEIKGYKGVGNTLNELYKTIMDRKLNPKEGSYTQYLFEKGLDKILKKVGEETAEVIIGAKNNKEELIYETSDLIYHMIVLLVNEGVSLGEIMEELNNRMK
ncbi:bifunctional phosphoribosyl-AMP cyclohydrolase/phosphoribosyl-ATP diphosphatase HisIE [Tissierella creatinini]|nr:bifunctional phosphoribosyl-AMP cyclohydrolase/phosphoribosyl-ATP diphosphatase HisIE [Tissierella creatinini]TJX66742.1 bifunctional phosphoribosyl-AMP cyclohydrolase/phosphoribosyl-ATP diphosphatase HisIE [Soehngenia saccharolytica]